MYDEIAMRVLRQNLRWAMDLVSQDHRRLMVLRNGQAVAGLVSAHDLRVLDRVDSNRMELQEREMEEQLRKFQMMKEALARERLT